MKISVVKNLFLLAFLFVFAVSCIEKNQDLPVFEKTADELQETYDKAIAEANLKLDKLVSEDKKSLTFDNTVKCYADIQDIVSEASLRNELLSAVLSNGDAKDKALELSEKYQSWFIDVQANGDVFSLIKEYNDTNPTNLAPEEAKLLADTLGGFERAGFNDEGVVPQEIIDLQNEIIALQTIIEQAVADADTVTETFTPEELDGIDPSVLADFDMDGANYIVKAGDRSKLRNIMKLSPKEAVREKAMAHHNTRATDSLETLTEIVQKRVELAKLFGYNTWADYQTSNKMAKDGDTAYDFVTSVSNGLKPKFEEEIGHLANYLEVGVNDDNGEVNAWDVYYFIKYYEQDFNVDYDAIKEFFPYEQTLQSMFDVYAELFDLEFTFIEDPDTWHEDVKIVEIRDSFTQLTKGYLYLDMFPRIDDGKQGHFSSWNTVDGKELKKGGFRPPINTLLCNFPVDAEGNPLPMEFGHVSTLFHEFGHALHHILGSGRFTSQSGFGVPQDFVEVPSQVLENWITDKVVFKNLAQGMPEEEADAMVDSIRAANKATIALFYERQFAFGIMDLIIHGYENVEDVPAADSTDNLIKITNDVLAETYLAFPETSSQITSFNHLSVWGYDAGYYGYAWADAIVAELAMPFEESPNGFMDKGLAISLREEIFEAGASRDVNVSVEAFLGEELDPERKAFLKRLGIEIPVP